MKETILLKQITPMWHFEPDIKGCCLRATEVKPKLDRFLLSKEKEELVKYKIGKTDALDYKLSFDVEYKEGGKKKENIKNIIEFKKCNLFFGNIKSTNPKKLIYYDGPITMIIFTLHENIIGLIKKYLCEFFATNSFGTRQDKGFGYFFPVGGIFNKPYGAKYKFYITKDIPQGTQTDYEDIFKYIDYFHKLIRSGINMNGVYYKSLMYHYARSMGLQWDKPFIRHHFQLTNKVYKSICARPPYDKGDIYSYVQRTKNGKKTISYENRTSMAREYEECERNKSTHHDKFLFRDALGLASIQEWRAYGDTISVEADNDKFVRFKSPINYRPCINIYKDSIELIVYIHFDESGLAKLKKQKFTIHSSRHQNSMHNMEVYENFSLENYFAFIEQFYQQCREENKKINQTLFEDNRNGGGYKRKNLDNANVSMTPADYIDAIFNPKRRNFTKIEE